ncbi:MacS family sensor histidine kinase [Planotetraspora kaengkrachanensis]|uniref:Histidine kinase n=1 Tax=Planotetraspora kaengkrachanensis TaxID=575193 RepID=A0A8J3M4X9_9ACTN|nr:DUF5931 domain-containing protein [Planotetraspora kaengkrachanensis]GIG77130.1 histidine kinase [Planotetraspora kaengkrachanensis]
MGIEGPFWRAIAVFRVASLVYAAVLLIQAGGYGHPVAGWLVIGVMAAWTVFTAAAYPSARAAWPLLLADLAVTAGCLLSTPLVQDPADASDVAMPITATWVAGPALAWGVARGRRAGAVSAAILSAGDLWLRGSQGINFVSIPVNGAVLLFLAGVVVGHVAQLAREAEELMRRAVQLEAAGRERERLARGIHDSVLQVLALVQRRGAEIGGEAAELGRLAGEQESALRALVQAPAPAGDPAEDGLPDQGGPRRRSLRAPDQGGPRRRPLRVPDEEGPADRVDLRDLLRPYGSARVTVSAPATALFLPAGAAHEVGAAVGAALDNVSRHCAEGTRAWVLAEQDGETVTVSVRDEGPGIPDGRLEQAAADGRMGVARSIRGRIADLGGTVAITSSRTGTEIELSVPADAGRRRRV